MEKPHWLDEQAYPYTPLRFRTVDGEISYLDEGHGPTVVLVHGTPTWSFEWRHVVEGLKHSHRLLAPDHLGFGLSEQPEGVDYRPEAHARRFAEFMSATVPASEPVMLVVHDFGGPIALDWALRNPKRVSRVILVNTWMWSFDDDAAMKRKASLATGALGRWLYRHLNASVRLVLPAAYGNRRLLTKKIHCQYLSVFPDPDSRERVLFALAKSLLGSSGFYDALWSQRHQLTDMSPAILWGLKDGAFPAAMLERWRREFPKAPIVTFANAGHWPHEEEPEAFVEALKGLIQAQL